MQKCRKIFLRNKARGKFSKPVSILLKIENGVYKKLYGPQFKGK